MILKTYIETTRRTKGERSGELNNYYKGIFNTIKKYLPSSVFQADIEVIYTSNKTAEVICADGKNFLLYDQYLGQVLNMLNRLHFNSENQIEAMAYGYKLFAEEFQLLGESELALALALSYRKDIELSETYKNDVDANKRALYTGIQEVFVMMHEMMHLHLTMSPNEELLNSIKNSTLALIKEKDEAVMSLEVEEQILDQMLKDYHYSVYGDDGSYKDFLTEAQIAKIKEDWITTRDYTRMRNLVETSNIIVEEIVCDDLAIFILIEYAKQEHKLPIQLVLDASYLALLHLRILGLINKSTHSFFEGEREMQDFLLSSQIRLLRMRDKATCFYSTYVTEKNGEELVHKMLTATNERYLKAVFDPIAYKCQSGLTDVKESIKKTVKDCDFQAWEIINTQIDLILNGGVPNNE